MKRRTGLVAYAQYLAIRCALALVQIFPIELNLRTAALMARIWRLMFPRHYHLAIAHLKASFPNGPYSDAEIEALADRCLHHWTSWIMELVATPRLITPFTWGRYIRLVNFKDAMRVLLEGKGAILVTGHYGQFELTGHLLSFLGFQVVAVMRPIDNEYLNRYLVTSRRTHGLRLLDKRGATEHAGRLLREGAAIAFIADQNAGAKGLFVDFFGRPASTYKSIGLLAMSTNRPIIIGYARRRGLRFQYDIGVERIIYPHEWEREPDPLRWITQTYTAAIESIVRAEPEQYLWIHRRWKSQPRHGRGAAVTATQAAAVQAVDPSGSGS